jgi:hypothetical protein
MTPQTPPESMRPDDGARLVGIPGFEAGGLVERTGIALVHEGEYIVPAPGSEAVVSPAGADARAGQVINYYFPVEVEVLGSLSPEQLQRVAAYVYADLRTELESWGIR